MLAGITATAVVLGALVVALPYLRRFNTREVFKELAEKEQESQRRD